MKTQTRKTLEAVMDFAVERLDDSFPHKFPNEEDRFLCIIDAVQSVHGSEIVQPYMIHYEYLKMRYEGIEGGIF
ncbi:hypothetical protein LCGC14_0462410 [marine sediment metagenome]|uniref:Uncharacterized protein n=1 Tax=marine sediment metagenome TaxID=412755 RepID=A0A0F9SXN1_9ZZZZ